MSQNESYFEEIQRVKSPRILHFVDTLDLDAGGVTRAIIDLATALGRDGLDSPIACANIGRLEEPAIHYPKIDQLLVGRGYWMKVKRLISESDVVHLHSPWWTHAPKIVRIASELNRPVVFSTHGMLDTWSLQQKALKKYTYLLMLGRRMMRKCYVHCTADDERRQVLLAIKPKDVFVVPLLINSEYFNSKLNREVAVKRWPFVNEARKGLLLFLGRIHPKKGIEFAIEAMKNLDGFELVIAGPCDDSNYLKQLKNLSALRGVESRVRWLGSVHGDEKHSLLSCCDCLILPTYQENFGLVLVEALGMGLHVISSRGTDICSEIERCNAVIVDQSPTAIANAVLSFFDSRMPREQILGQQRSLLIDWLSPDKVIRKYGDMYTECIGRSSAT